MSRVRANKITNKDASGAPLFTHGANITGVATATKFVGNVEGTIPATIGTGVTVTAVGIVSATKYYGDGSNLTGLASREIYGFTGIGSHLQLTYTNNGADNISGDDFAAFEDEFIGPSGITWSINNSGNLIATI